MRGKGKGGMGNEPDRCRTGSAAGRFGRQTIRPRVDSAAGLFGCQSIRPTKIEFIIEISMQTSWESGKGMGWDRQGGWK